MKATRFELQRRNLAVDLSLERRNHWCRRFGFGQIACVAERRRPDPEFVAVTMPRPVHHFAAERPIVEFWFDFSSPYAYFASLEMDGLGARTAAEIVWRPFMLGAAFKMTGAAALTATPLKDDYARHDWQRIARLNGYPFRLPDVFPQSALAATRMFYWIDQQDERTAIAFAKKVFELYFTKSFNLFDATEVSHVAAECGFEMNEAFFGSQSAEIKERSKVLGSDAIARGAFGAPFFFVDNEPFWGWDRIGMVEQSLVAANQNKAFWRRDTQNTG